jgi:hypothetical protein
MDGRSQPTSHQPRRRCLLPSRTRGQTGSPSVRTGAPAPRARQSQGRGGQTEGARTEAGGRRQGTSGAEQGVGGARETRGRAAFPNLGHREEVTGREDELGRGCEAAEGGRAAGAGPRSLAQECVNQPRFLAKKILRGPLETFSGFTNFFGVAMRRSGCRQGPAT